MAYSFELSIIIPTLGRLKELEALFASIIASKLSLSYEVIVVDQNENLIDELVHKYESSIPIKHHKVSFKGLSMAKNYGVRVADGRIVCFPDDDAEFCLNTIGTALDLLNKKQADCVFGKCVEKNSGKDSVMHFKTCEEFLDLHNFDGSFIEATMFALTDVMKQYPYDESMGVGTIFGSQEGYDLVYRLLTDGKVLFYSPQIIFYHPNKISNRNSTAEIKRAFYYSCGWGYLCKKHNFKKKFKKRYLKVKMALPIIFTFRHKQYKYFKAQYMGLILGYRYL